jgi:phosphate transport system substrate-binding protein
VTTLAAVNRRERRTVGFRPNPRVFLLALAVVVLAVAATGCGRDESSDAEGNGAGGSDGEPTQELSGRIEADGSSTVGPLTTLAAERFQEQQPGVQVTVGISGTGGGFERFCAGETDISDASRPIKEDEEVPVCQKAGIDHTEFQVAVDALTVVVNSENDWVDCLTTDQLKKIWQPGSKIKNWNQIDPSFPDEKLTLAGPGTDSGTFDYFTDEINGEEGASRTDYTASEDDNVVVQAVEGDKGGLGYFGYTYYEENEDRLKALEVDSGSGCVAPSAEAAQSGEYTPLSRPLFIYVKNESLQRPEVKGFVSYYIDNAVTLADEGRFIPAPEDVLAEDKAEFEQATGS